MTLEELRLLDMKMEANTIDDIFTIISDTCKYKDGDMFLSKRDSIEYFLGSNNNLDSKIIKEVDILYVIVGYPLSQIPIKYNVLCIQDNGEFVSYVTTEFESHLDKKTRLEGNYFKLNKPKQ